MSINDDDAAAERAEYLARMQRQRFAPGKLQVTIKTPRFDVFVAWLLEQLSVDERERLIAAAEQTLDATDTSGDATTLEASLEGFVVEAAQLPRTRPATPGTAQANDTTLRELERENLKLKLALAVYTTATVVRSWGYQELSDYGAAARETLGVGEHAPWCRWVDNIDSTGCMCGVEQRVEQLQQEWGDRLVDLRNEARHEQ